MPPDEPRGKDEEESASPDESKRNFLKYAVTFSALLAAGGVAAVTKSITKPALSEAPSSKTFPKVKIAQLSDLNVNEPVTFNYPLENEPNVLVKLGTKADGGVGPDGDIVAFSLLCQHLGCVYAFQSPHTSPSCNPAYKADSPVGYCCCHGSVFDFLHSANVVSGPSPRPQPQVKLEVDSSGNIFATGMGPPTVFGHNTGSSDVSADLEGGTPVG